MSNVPSNYCALRRLKSACTSSQSNQSSLSTWSIFASFDIQTAPVKILIRLRECAVWSESSLGAYVRRYVFWHCGSYGVRGYISWRCDSYVSYKLVAIKCKHFSTFQYFHWQRSGYGILRNSYRVKGNDIMDQYCKYKEFRWLPMQVIEDGLYYRRKNISGYTQAIPKPQSTTFLRQQKERCASREHVYIILTPLNPTFV